MGSAATVDASTQLGAAVEAASVEELRSAWGELSPEAKGKVTAALMELLIKGAAASEIRVKVCAELISGEKLEVEAALSDSVMDLKTRLAKQMDVPDVQLRLISGSCKVCETGQLMDELFKEPVAAVCKALAQEKEGKSLAEEEMHIMVKDACCNKLAAVVQVAVVASVSVSTEGELRNAVAEGVKCIRIPDKTEITLQERREVKIEDQEEKEEEAETERAADDEEDEEDDKEYEAVPLSISKDLEIIGGSGSVLRQESWASTGVRDECALAVDGAAVRLEGITLDRGGVNISNGGSVDALDCRMINAGWFVSEASSSLKLERCAMQGSITKFVGVSEGAMAKVSGATFTDGGCWSSNIVAEGLGSKIVITKFSMENSEGAASLAASDGAILECEDGSVRRCNSTGLIVEGMGTTAIIRRVALEGNLPESCNEEAGIVARSGGKVVVEGMTIRNFHKGVFAAKAAEIHINSVSLSGNELDYVQAGGIIQGVASDSIVQMPAREEVEEEGITEEAGVEE